MAQYPPRRSFRDGVFPVSTTHIESAPNNSVRMDLTSTGAAKINPLPLLLVLDPEYGQHPTDLAGLVLGDTNLLEHARCG